MLIQVWRSLSTLLPKEECLGGTHNFWKLIDTYMIGRVIHIQWSNGESRNFERGGLQKTMCQPHRDLLQIHTTNFVPFYAIRPLTNKPMANRGGATAASPPFESASAMKSFVLRTYWVLLSGLSAGYDPYETPYYARNVALAVLTCFFTLVVFIVLVNFIGFLIGGGQRPVQQTRTAQI